MYKLGPATGWYRVCTLEVQSRGASQEAGGSGKGS